jgi:hypothetical protein
VDQRLSRRTAWEIYRSDGKMKSRERASVPLPAFLGIDEFQPEPPAAKQKTELPLKNQRKMSEQPGLPHAVLWVNTQPLGKVALR